MTRHERRLALLLPDLGGGGAERVALQLVRSWTEAGYEVDIVLLRKDGILLDLLPPEVLVFDLGAQRIRNGLLPLIRYLKLRRPAAVQASMWPLTLIAIIAHTMSRLKGRLVVSEHIALSQQYRHFGRLRRRFLAWSIRILYPVADARIAVSERAADDLASLSGVPRESIQVIYNPVGQPSGGAKGEERVELLWGGDGARILNVGRLADQKNQALLIRAFAKVRRQRMATLIIVGEGPLRSTLEEIAIAEGVGADVVFTGFEIDPQPFFATADLFVLSSDYEGFGLVLVEALQHGVPVVSTDCESGPREILSDGAFGTLVPCGNDSALASAMDSALDRAHDREALKSRGARMSGRDAPLRYLESMLGGALRSP